jgi:3-oxoacyl-(acyl-carrier-protein) synthase/acyl carrier protein
VVLHPLVHRNTSDFTQQSYRSVFGGDELFLEEDPAGDLKTLSGAAYLEMGRVAAMYATCARESESVVELHGISWGRPFAVARDRDSKEEITISVAATDEGSVEFDIHSTGTGEEVVHCQGRAVLGPGAAASKLDLQQLGAQIDAAASDQLLVPIRLAPVAECLLHPRLIAAVLRAAADSQPDFVDLPEPAGGLPRTLRSVSVVAACPSEAVAWVRRGPGGDLDIDLCDRQGNVCLRMKGLVLGDRVGQSDTSASVAEYRQHSAPPEQARSSRQLQDELKESLAEALFLKVSDISVDKPFIELGLDSIVGVEWVNRINKTYGIKITATKVYDYPNISEFAAWLANELRGQITASPPRQPANTHAESAAPVARAYADLKRGVRTRRTLQRSDDDVTEKIAIIGMSGRYPQASNLQQYWDNLASGRNSIVEIPPSRWDLGQYYDPDPNNAGKIYCKWIGMLDDVECFDSLFFKISPAEAESMDPQHRLFLEESYRAFESAGYCGKSLSQKKCGVYLGIIGNDYSAIVTRGASPSVDITGNNLAIGAARIAYFLNLKGPAITIDTACSSSLVAIHLACQGLLNHETDMALAGGVTVYLDPRTYVGMCQAGMLSPDGQCKTFDDSANGFVPGEGVGAVVLKRLRDAQRDNDPIHGVILCSGINQDGKTNGITAPSVNSQIELGRELYSRYRIDPETISYVETHGTGTKLGDPIELEALATVFREKTSKKHYCGLGSVKSNVGHTSGAAGVAGVQKVLLSMRHRTLVPSLNVSRENSLFDFASSPFYICKETRPWSASPGSLRRAAVSSFGFSGTNAHLVLEEYVPPPTDRGASATVLRDAGVGIVLSARTPEQLRQRALDLVDFIGSEGSESTDLMSIAYTLAVGRDALDERLGLVVSSVGQLAAKLQKWLSDGEHAEDVHCGRVERGNDGVALVERRQDLAEWVSQCIAARDFAKLVELWGTGLELDWRRLYADIKVRRISLPTYPFAKKRHWMQPAVSVPPAPESATTALHPLVHRNISVLGQQTYSTTFSGEEFFFVKETESRGGAKVLPAVAYLEMARTAVAMATANARKSLTLELHDVVWGRPLVASKDREVNVALFAKDDMQIAFEIYSAAHGSEGLVEDLVHCQGHADLLDERQHATLDIERLKTQLRKGKVMGTGEGVDSIYLGEGQLLAELHLPIGQAGGGEWWQHPGLMEAVLQAAASLFGGSQRRPRHLSLPCALDSLVIGSPPAPSLFAWIRHAQNGRKGQRHLSLDVDVCDQCGDVCIKLRGVTYEATASNAAVVPATVPQFAPAVRQVKEKPAGISLIGVGGPISDITSRRAPVVTLDSAGVFPKQ